VEVSLISMPTPAPVPVKQPEPPKTLASPKAPEPKPVAAPTRASAPAPVVREATPVHAPATPVGHTARDVLKDIQLPPDAPKVGELAPVKSVAQPQHEAKVKLPDVPRVPDPIQDPVAKIPSRATLSDDADKELEEELKKVRQFTPAPKLDIIKKENKPI